jgi:hypothetical protein
MIRRFMLCLVLSGAPLTAGCPGSIEDPALFRRNVGGRTCPPDFDVEQDLLEATCGRLGCHTGGESFAAAGLDLAAPGVGERILAHTSEQCGGLPMIEGTDVEGSYFRAKLDDDPPCGDRMPSGMDELNLSERACLDGYLRELVAPAGVDGGSGQ